MNTKTINEMERDTVIRGTFESWIRRGKAIRCVQCTNYAEMGLAAWAQGRDVDAFVYLDKAKHHYFQSAEELPF